MMDNLYSGNSPPKFWQCINDISDDQWQSAINASLHILQLSKHFDNYDSLIEKILGEGQFGPDQWKLSTAKRLYYVLKPILPRDLTRKLRQFYSFSKQAEFPIGWPIEFRYVHFLWNIMQEILITKNQDRLDIKSIWPGKKYYAFVLTHDIETSKGLAHVRKVMELEIENGFRSSFNFIPESYDLDFDLIRDLHDAGFEVGVHGLKHDGKLFSSQKEFDKRAKQINYYLRKFNAVGFRSPLTHRNPYWMQSLNIEYDLSFFDTDPFEPIPGGTMSIWPFMIGSFVELPYTLPQDYTLIEVLNDKSPKVWLNKVDFIEKYHGIALLNSHPDYLLTKENWDVYANFLSAMKARDGYWHALPKEAASWWRNRMSDKPSYDFDPNHISSVNIIDNELVISP